MSKKDLIKEVKDNIYKASDFNEFNQFLCDIIYKLLPYLSEKGLKYLNEQCIEVQDGLK